MKSEEDVVLIKEVVFKSPTGNIGTEEVLLIKEVVFEKESSTSGHHHVKPLPLWSPPSMDLITNDTPLGFLVRPRTFDFFLDTVIPSFEGVGGLRLCERKVTYEFYAFSTCEWYRQWFILHHHNITDAFFMNDLSCFTFKIHHKGLILWGNSRFGTPDDCCFLLYWFARVANHLIIGLMSKGEEEKWARGFDQINATINAIYKLRLNLPRSSDKLHMRLKHFTKERKLAFPSIIDSGNVYVDLYNKRTLDCIEEVSNIYQDRSIVVINGTNKF